MEHGISLYARKPQRLRTQCAVSLGFVRGCRDDVVHEGPVLGGFEDRAEYAESIVWFRRTQRIIISLVIAAQHCGFVYRCAASVKPCL